LKGEDGENGKSRKISILLAVAMLVSIMIPTTAFAGPTKAPTKDGKYID